MPMALAQLSKLQTTKAKFLKKKDEETDPLLDKPDVLTFDVGFFERTPHSSPECLSLESQKIMRKPTTERTEDEIEIAQDALRDIEFFKRFPHNVQYELCKGMVFLTVKSGKFILREGHTPLFMYIVISGIVNIFRHETDVITGHTRIIRLRELSHGMFFGHEDLLHDRPRTISAKCRITAQVLELDKDLFNKLLRNFLLRDEKLIYKTLRTLETLSHFEYQESEYRDLVTNVKIGRFPADTIIFGGTAEVPFYVHFIISGDCALEQDMEFIVETGLGYTFLRPVPPTTDQESSDLKIHKKRLKISVLMRGHYFGMGENMSRRYVRSLCLVETLMIPRHLLVAKRVNSFDKLKEQFEDNMPSLREILDQYLEVLNWQRYQSKFIRQVLNIGAKKKEPKFINPLFVKYV